MSKLFIRMPSQDWPRPSQMKTWYKTGQQWTQFPFKEITPLVKTVCETSIESARLELLSKLPLEQQSIPAACVDASGKRWNLLELAVVRWETPELAEVISHLDLKSDLVREQMGQSLTSLHKFLNRGKSSGAPYMPVESKFTQNLLFLVAAGAPVEKPYWQEPASIQRANPRGVFASGEREIGIVSAAIHALADEMAARAVQNLAAQGYDVDTLNEHAPSTALHIACRRGMLATVEALLDLGADPALKTKNGWNAYSFARAGKHSQVVHMLDACRARRVIQHAVAGVKAVPR